MLINTEINLIKGLEILGLEGSVTKGEDLRNHTTLRIGGRAEIFIEPSSWEDIQKIIIFANKNQIPLFILGGGSKILFPDGILKGIVVNLNNPFFKKIHFCEEAVVNVGSGVSINELLRWMVNNSLGEWEFLAGIPATLGGAVCLNAGVRQYPEGYIQIGDFVKAVTVMDRSGHILKQDKKNLNFGYRNSNLSDSIILEVSLLRGEKKNCKHIRKKISDFLNYRKRTQDLKFPNAGCVFKNPLNGKSSGELIELSGLKGKRIGDVAISKKHANFFINLGKATTKDFLILMEYVQKKVKRDHGIWLEPEIRIIKDKSNE